MNNGGIVMVEVTKTALSVITKEVQDIFDQGKKPFIRITMGIG